jgi:hypothetical protein
LEGSNDLPQRFLRRLVRHATGVVVYLTRPHPIPPVYDVMARILRCPERCRSSDGVMMLPPTGKPTHAKLHGGPCGGEVVRLQGTHYIAAPILKKDGRYWNHDGYYRWVINSETRETAGYWKTT